MGEQRDFQLLVPKGFGLVKNAGLPEGDYGNTGPADRLVSRSRIPDWLKFFGGKPRLQV